nr:Transposon Ty3-G Gag-Pol polyprotein [Ipomoea batatas]
MNKVTGVTEQQLVSFFIGGLKPHFIKELLMAKPGTLMASFSLAKAYEAHHDELLMEYRTVNRGNTRFAVSIVENKRVSSVVATTPISGRFMSTRSPLPPPLTDVAKGLLPALDTTTKGASGSPLPIRKYSAAELRDRRDNGLCFHCDQKYTTGHRWRSHFPLLVEMTM